MTLNEYQKESDKFTKTNIKNNISYSALGLAGESGEVCDKIKKSIRDGNLDRDSIILELGDVLWYLARICDNLQIDLDVVAKLNIQKLTSRTERNVISGEGDNR